MHPMLNIAVRAARRAGSIINRASLNGGALNVRAKRVNDFVTQVDQAAEEAIIEIVRKAHPDHGFLAEESAAPAVVPDSSTRWTAPPISSTAFRSTARRSRRSIAIDTQNSGKPRMRSEE